MSRRIQSLAEIEALKTAIVARGVLMMHEVPFCSGFSDGVTYAISTAPTDTDIDRIRQIIMEHGRSEDLDTLVRLSHLAARPR